MHKGKVVAIIQARMGSTRLPGKVLMDIAGVPMLERCLRRLGQAKNIDQIVVATTTLAADQVLADFCAQGGWPCQRGSEEDVLDRYYQTARVCQAQVVVRVCSDSPLVDPALVDQVVAEFLERLPQVDYACNRLPAPTFPIGFDVEVLTMPALERAWREDANPAWREHVTPYLYFNPDKFRIHSVTCPQDLSHLRLTVDTPQDLELARLIYAHFGHDRFSWREVVELLESKPAWQALNCQVKQKTLSANGLAGRPAGC